MPLENFVPIIDDRRFDDIVAEMRTRIVRYTPEWTDFNDNDPGITMVQLFAWLADMMLYRMNQVPLLNYIKFLQLLGIELNAAGPAQAEITFPVATGFTDPYVIVPQGTQVAATSTDGSPPLVFETDRALYAFAPLLKSLQAFDSVDYTDVHADNDDPGQGFEPFGPAVAGSALLLGFDYAGAFPAQVELNLAVWAFAPETQPAPYNCGLPQTQSYPSAQIAWEYWNGSDWRALTLLKDETLALTQTGHVLLKTPAKELMSKALMGVESEQRYWIRARLQMSAYENPPQLLAIRTNTTTATQAETVNSEVLGGSNGMPNQVFTLANTPIVQNSLILQVDEGDGNGFQTWTPVSDFFGSSSTDQYYVLDRASGEVRFGDGVQGAIPVANVNNADGNVLALVYRFGGGTGGNVGAGRLQTLITPVTGIDESGVTNLQAAYGGQAEETFEQAQERARQSLKNKCRAVTNEDFEALAKESANIARAKALPLFHPKFPEVQVPGVVTVIVVPNSTDPAPMPSDGTLRTVCAYLSLRRLLTTEVYVIAPTYSLVEVQVQAIAQDNADVAEVNNDIQSALLTYFHPLLGGDDQQGWPFGGTIYYSRVYQQVFSVPGVERIDQLTITVDGTAAPECTNVAIPQGVLLYSTEHTVQVNYDFNE